MNKNRIGKVIGFTRRGIPVYLVKGGSEPTFDSPQDPGTGTGTVEPEEPKAPWADYLSDLPESVRPLVEPKFKEWDANVTKKFQEVHSTYEPLKVYESLAQQGHNPQFLAEAIQFVEAFNSDPEKVFKAMQEHYGFGVEQGQGNTDPNQLVPDNNDDQYDPRFLQLEQNQQLLADIITAQHEAEQAAQLDQALNAELTAAATKHGDFDEKVVLGWCAADPNLSIDAAVQQYKAAIEAAVAKRQTPNVPIIMGGGGSVPSTAIDPGKLSPKDRKSLVTSYLEAAGKDS
jgi:hypothetical protein